MTKGYDQSVFAHTSPDWQWATIDPDGSVRLWSGDECPVPREDGAGWTNEGVQSGACLRIALKVNLPEGYGIFPEWRKSLLWRKVAAEIISPFDAGPPHPSFRCSTRFISELPTVDIDPNWRDNPSPLKEARRGHMVNVTQVSLTPDDVRELFVKALLLEYPEYEEHNLSLNLDADTWPQVVAQWSEPC